MIVINAKEHLNRLIKEVEDVTDEAMQMELATLPHINCGESIGILDSFGKRLQTLQSQKEAMFNRAYEIFLKAVEHAQAEEDLDGTRCVCQELQTDMFMISNLITYTCMTLYPEGVGDWLTYENNIILVGQNFGVHLATTEDYPPEDVYPEQLSTLH